MSDTWGYHTPPEQQAVIDAQYKKASRTAARRPLPSNVLLSHSERRTRAFGADPGTEVVQHSVRAVELHPDGAHHRDLGELTWAGDDGYVAWMGAPAHIVPHLLAKAHEVSVATGDAPPTYAEDLSPSSHRLMRKYLPTHVPEGVTVAGMPLLTPEHFARATETVNAAHAAALASVPAVYHNTVNIAASAARSAVTEGRRSHSALQRLGDQEHADEYDNYQQHASKFYANSHLLANTVEKHGAHTPDAVHALRRVSDFML